MKFTKIIAVVTAALMLCMSLAACTGNAKDDGKDTEMTDYEYVKDKGKLVVGITSFEPMDYQNEKG